MNNHQETTEFLSSLARAAQQDPFALAVVTDRVSIDYRTLDELVWRFSAYIREALKEKSVFLGDGANIAIRIANPVKHYILSLSLLRMGCAQLSLSEDSTLDMIENAVEAADGSLVICDEIDSRLEVQQLQLHGINYRILMLKE